MSEYCVVVAQGSRARFFTLEPAEVPEMEGGRIWWSDKR